MSAPPITGQAPTDVSSVVDEKMTAGEPTSPEKQADASHDAVDTLSSAPTATELVGGGEEKSDEIEYVTGFKLVSLMTSVTLVVFLMLLDMSIIVTAIPRITTQFHSLPDVGWYGSAYNLSSAALQPLTGKFYTYFKTKWTFLAFLFLFELGSLVCGLANSSKMLIIGRAVAGLGSSGLMNGALTIISMAAPLEKRPSLMGVCIGVSQLGIVGGPLIGGALTEYTTWRWCFYINLPIGAIATVLIVITRIPDRRVMTDGSLFRTLVSKLDLTGFALFAPAAIMILLAVQWGGNEYDWNSATIIGLLCGGFATAAVFVFWEHRVGNDAMIPLPVLRKRQVWTACLTTLFFFCNVMIAAYYLPIYFQSVKGASPLESGVNSLPSIIPQLAMAVAGGFAIQKVGYYLPFSVASAVLTTIGNGLITTLDVDSSTAMWAGYQVILGIGRGMGMQVSILAIQANTEPSMTAVATAVMVFAQTFGGALILAIGNAVFNNKLEDELKSRLPHKIAVTIIGAGARGMRDVTPAEYLNDALKSYANAVNTTFYVAVAACICMFVTSWGIGWKDIRKKKPSKAGDA